MEINRVVEVYWSPTGGTRTVTETVAKEAAEQLWVPRDTVDFTLPEARRGGYLFGPEDLVIFGMPTQAGKTPNRILPYLKSAFRGNGALAVSVVTYGGRSYDHALAELCAVLEGDGFHTIAAGAFLSRHVFSQRLCAGRPGWSDLFDARQLARNAAEKARVLMEIPEPVQVPGDPEGPYYVPLGLDGAPAEILRVRPSTDLLRCHGCGLCARVCPMGAIDPRDISQVSKFCVKCHACVRSCPQQAKAFTDPAFLSHVAMLEASCTGQQENELFF